ncbi:MAG: vitamin K epoxide reductase family protein, partial [Actinobacteria bacterium]|nr:vitamin K epoxide reductase family protein [Actinomycetota bacterium]
MTDTTPTFASETRNSKVSGITLLLAAIAGFLASFVLTIDKLKILKDSNYKPSCNINAVLNCKSVMLSQEAEVFGFPNSLIGIAAFAMMLVVAVSLLMGVEFPKRFWQLLVPGPIFAVGFSHYLAYQTTFEIGALCPYCMVAWVASLLTLA